MLVAVIADRLIAVPHGLHAVYYAGTQWRESETSDTGIDALPATDALKHRRRDYADRPFSVEWRGFIVALRGGTYTLATSSDDGSWLYVRDTLVVENPGHHSAIEARGSVTLTAGVHPVFIRYFQDGGDCAFEARWARGSDPLEPVPASAWLAEPTTYGRLIGEQVASTVLLALAAIWAVLLMHHYRTVPIRAAHRVTLIWQDMPPAFRSVLLLSVLLNIWGIWWALPNMRGWAPDEVVPVDVLDAARVMFSGGWHTKYPPFHYALLSVADAPIRLLARFGTVVLDSPGSYLGLFLTARLVSVVMAAGTVYAVYLCGRELYGSIGAVFAALTTALMAPFVYYGKLANLDVPYLFWFAVSLLAYLRIIERHARRDYVLFAVCAALAVCTKDQAYGLYALALIAIVAARWERWRRDGRPTVTVLFDATMLLALAAGLATFLIADNVIFNFSGFSAHVAEVLGPASTAYRMFDRNPTGQVQMAALALRELGYMFGWPLAAVVAIAVLHGLTVAPPGRRRRLWWLVVPGVSYYVSFLVVVSYFFDRFLLPIGLILSLFAGYGLERFLDPLAPARRWRLALVSCVFGYTLVYAATVNYALTTDSRYTVTSWLQARVRPGQVIAARGPLEYFILADRFASVSIDTAEDVAALRPSFIVLNADQIAKLPAEHPMRAMHDALMSGRDGYSLALRYRTPSLPWPGHHPDLGEAPRARELSSLGAINPTLEVFERQDG